jgi:hypothetical protein
VELLVSCYPFGMRAGVIPTCMYCFVHGSLHWQAWINSTPDSVLLSDADTRGGGIQLR